MYISPLAIPRQKFVCFTVRPRGLLSSPLAAVRLLGVSLSIPVSTPVIVPFHIFFSGTFTRYALPGAHDPRLGGTECEYADNSSTAKVATPRYGEGIE